MTKKSSEPLIPVDAKIGDRVVLLTDLDKIDWDSIHPHPEGAILRRGNALSLNGNLMIASEPFDRCVSHPKGVVMVRGRNYFLNDRCPISETQALTGYSRPPCAISRKESNGSKQIFLACDSVGEKPAEESFIELTEGDWDNWESHPLGVMFLRKGTLTLVITTSPAKVKN